MNIDKNMSHEDSELSEDLDTAVTYLIEENSSFSNGKRKKILNKKNDPSDKKKNIANMSIANMRNTTTNKEYQIIRKIGSGMYGTVFLAECNKKMYALKQVLRIGRKRGLPLSFIRELKTISTIKHKNIVDFLECKSNIVKNQIEIFMVFEYMPMDLCKFMNKKFLIEEKLIREIGSQIFEALHYLHSKNIIHRDIKPGNILVNNENQLVVKLADFGMSRSVPKPEEIDETYIEAMSDSEESISNEIENSHQGKNKLPLDKKDDTTIYENRILQNSKKNKDFFKKIKNSHILMSEGICTLWYRAPEVLNYRPYDNKMDVWSVGVILLELVCLENKLAGEDEQDQHEKIEGLNNILESVWQRGVNTAELRDLIKKCLTIDPKERLSAQNALKCKFFSKKNY